MRRIFLIWLLLSGLVVSAKEVIPPAPEHYFNDYAGLVSKALGQNLNKQLEDLEKQTSSQLIVAVYPKMQTDSAIEDYANRVFREWKVGQTNKNNGAVLFIFVEDHQMRVEVGYGLEGVLPDITCRRIISDRIAPAFKAEHYEIGLMQGVDALSSAIREGPATGNGTTVAQNAVTGEKDYQDVLFFVVVAIIAFFFFASFFLPKGRSGGWTVSSGGFGGWSGGGGGGGWSGGGGGGGGGGFSGGGGSSGGGGASGSW